MVRNLAGLIASVAAALVVLGSERPAVAFCRTTTLSTEQPPAPDQCPAQGLPLYWSGRCVMYSVSRTASRQVDYETASRVAAAAFDTWTGLVCADSAGRPEPPSIALVQGAPTDATKAEYLIQGQNVNAIVFRDDGWENTDPTETLALTTLTFVRDTGVVLDADIQINTSEHAFTAEGPVPQGHFDLQTVLTHEAGHFLGFAHTSEAQAVMNPVYEMGSAKLKLGEDDVAAVCGVYTPRGDHLSSTGPVPASACSLAVADTPTCAPTVKRACSVAHLGSPATATGELALLGATFALAFARRRKRPDG